MNRKRNDSENYEQYHLSLENSEYLISRRTKFGMKTKWVPRKSAKRVSKKKIVMGPQVDLRYMRNRLRYAKRKREAQKGEMK